MRRITNRAKRILNVLLIFTVIMTAAVCLMPEEASAAGATVKIGGVDISSYNDNTWHAFNSKKPSISGWTAGKYKLSADKKTLYLDGFNYSGSNQGIYSSDALKVVASGTNTFTCKGAYGIGIGSIYTGPRNLTLEGASGSIINLNCTDTNSIHVYACTMSSGAVNAVGDAYFEASYVENGGDMTITGALEIGGHMTLNGGTLSITREMRIGHNASINNGTLKSDSYINVQGTYTQSGGTTTTGENLGSSSTLTIRGGSINSSESVLGSENINASGGRITAVEQIYCGGDMTITGGNITASSVGVHIIGNLIISDGTISGKNTSGWSGISVGGNSTITGTGKVEGIAADGNAFYTDGTLTVNGGSVNATNNAIPNSENRASSNLYANNIVVTGGTVSAKSNGKGGAAIYVVENIEVGGGIVSGINSDNNNSWSAVRTDKGDITVSGGTLIGTGNSSGYGITCANLSVSGYSNVEGTSGSGMGISASGTITQTGGTITGKNTVTDVYNYAVYCGGDTLIEKGEFNAETQGRYAFLTNTLNLKSGHITTKGGHLNPQIVTINGGTIDAYSDTGYAICTSEMTVNGGTINAHSDAGEAIYASKMTVNGGTINAYSDTGEAIRTSDMTVNSGTVKADSDYRLAIGTSKMTVNGGNIYANGSYGDGIWAGNLTIYSGYVEGTSKAVGGISSYNMVINGGELVGQSYNTDGRYDAAGISAADSFTMTDGKVTASLPNFNKTAILVPATGFELADDIWISDPSDVYLQDGEKNMEAFKPDGSYANEMTLQKVSSISVKSGPSGAFYDGDYFDPEGLVLNVKFVDGSTTDLSYNDAHKDMINLSLAENKELSVGNTSLTITALTKQTSTTIPVKQLGTTELSGWTSEHSASLRWDKVEGADSYSIYASDRESGQFTLIGNTTSTAFEDTGLPSGATKEYYVEVIGKSTSDKTITTESNHITLTTQLPAPQLQLTETGYDSLTIEWNAVEGAVEYEILRDNGNRMYDVVANTTDNFYVDQNLVTGRTYRYYVTAMIPKIDIRSKYSNYVEGTPEYDGTTTLTVANANNGYSLSWHAVDGATDYEIWRGTGAAGTQSLLETTSELTYTDDTADIYSVYNYMVKATRIVDGEIFYGGDSNIAVTVATVRPEPDPEPTPDEQIGSLQNDSDPKDAVFNLLQARAASTTKKSVRLKWNNVSGAAKYIIYGNKCGKKNRYKKLATVGAGKTGYNVTMAAGKKLKKGTYYKFIIIAVDKNGKAITTSKTIHAATKGGKSGNDKTVAIKAKVNSQGKKISSYKKLTTVSLKSGKKLKVKATAVPESKKLKVSRHRKVAFETSNRKVATVNSKGVIQTRGKGTCYIYAYAQDGVCTRLKVTVK